ncbi:hypothetical protein BGZ54_004914, partial [Gamsiella multidivaricata]
PVFDAAAVDYEVREALNEGQVRSMVAADIRKKRQIAAGKTPASSEQGQDAPVAPLKSHSDGIVVLGRVALGEVLKGYNDGCLQSLEDPEPVVVAEMVPEVSAKDEGALLSTEATGSVESTGDKGTTNEDGVTIAASTALSSTATPSSTTTSLSSSSPSSETATGTETATETTEKVDAKKKEAEAAPAPVKIPQDEAYFSLPASGLEPIGYIPFKNLVGFRNFHKKLFALFNSYDCVEYAGGAVMKIAFAETKDMQKEDLDMGKDEEPLFKKYRGPVEIDILDRVRENVKIYVTPEHIPEPRKVEEEDGLMQQ